jgi:D-alanyl-D-alanine-carboxypeptidase/D-alanyl-D-alanine-endopeptidase
VSSPMSDDAARIVDLFRPMTRRAPLVVVGVEFQDEVHVTSLGDEAGAQSEESLFEIGSITKTFTALLLANMVQREEVALSDPVSKYVAIENPVLSRVTLLDLATHTARLPGIPRDLLWRALRNRRDPYRGYDRHRLEAALAAAKERSGIGRKFRYSNFGFATLGHALSAAAGVSYEELIVSRICAPLGLAATSPAPSEELARRYVQGHKRKGRPVTPWDLASFAPAGVLKSSVRDMLTYLRAHVDPSSPSLGPALREVQRRRVGVRKGRLAIGLAWLIETRRGIEFTWHNGGTGGFSAFAGFSPGAKASVVALANAYGAGPLTRAGARALERLGKESLQ